MVDEEEYLEDINAAANDGEKAIRRGKLSQLMVFVNGFILTITAFATLVIFLNQVKESRIKVFNESLVADLQREFFDIDQSLLLAALYAETENQEDYLSPDFKTIARARKSPQGRWSIQYLEGQKFSSDLKSLISVIDGRIKGKNTIFISDENLASEYAVHRFKNQDLVIGEIKPDRMNSLLQSDAYQNLHRLKIFDEISGEKIFMFSRIGGEDVRAAHLEHHIQTIQVADSKIGLAIDMIQDSYFRFIEKLPYLLLLFGGTLTIVGTLYVRNNQKQSYQLEVMNTALEDKNKVLESKMNESHELYQELSKKEQEYESVLNAVQDILFEVDVTGHVKFMNAAWTQITGIDVDDIASKDLFKFFVKRDEGEIRSTFSQFLSDEKPMFLTTTLHTQDGGYRSVELSFSVVHKDKHNEQRIIGTIIDIEERRRAEKALDEAEKKYRTIVENAAGGIYQVGLDGEVMSANPALLKILGYDSLKDLQDSEFNIVDIFVSESDRKIYEKAMSTDGFIRNHETQIRRATGETIWVNENARAVTGMDGSILYYEGSIEDMTQRKQAEIDLMEAKLNSDLASRAKSEFLANMSHELRTPLNAIIGFSEIIKSEALGEIDQKPYVDYAKDIYSSGSRLLTVINEILGISKIEAGERQLNESVVDLKSVTQTCMDLLAAKIEANSIDVTSIIDDELPSIVAEEMAFKQMIMNLLSNAIKFTPAEGKITISSEIDSRGIRFSITDTGVGIDDGDIPKALSPFGQLDNALSRSSSGTGLGLTLVDSLIRLHGGRLELVSQKGIGTTVTLTVPEKRMVVKKVSESKESQSDNIASISDYKKS